MQKQALRLETTEKDGIKEAKAFDAVTGKLVYMEYNEPSGRKRHYYDETGQHRTRTEMVSIDGKPQSTITYNDDSTLKEKFVYSGGVLGDDGSIAAGEISGQIEYKGSNLSETQARKHTFYKPNGQYVVMEYDNRNILQSRNDFFKDGSYQCHYKLDQYGKTLTRYDFERNGYALVAVSVYSPSGNVEKAIAFYDMPPAGGGDTLVLEENDKKKRPSLSQEGRMVKEVRYLDGAGDHVAKIEKYDTEGYLTRVTHYESPSAEQKAALKKEEAEGELHEPERFYDVCSEIIPTPGKIAYNPDGIKNFGKHEHRRYLQNGTTTVTQHDEQGVPVKKTIYYSSGNVASEQTMDGPRIISSVDYHDNGSVRYRKHTDGRHITEEKFTLTGVPVSKEFTEGNKRTFVKYDLEGKPATREMQVDNKTTSLETFTHQDGQLASVLEDKSSGVTRNLVYLSGKITDKNPIEVSRSRGGEPRTNWSEMAGGGKAQSDFHSL